MSKPALILLLALAGAAKAVDFDQGVKTGEILMRLREARASSPEAASGRSPGLRSAALDEIKKILNDPEINRLVANEAGHAFDALLADPIGYTLRLYDNDPFAEKASLRCLYIVVDSRRTPGGSPPTGALAFEKFENCAKGESHAKDIARRPADVRFDPR